MKEIFNADVLNMVSGGLTREQFFQEFSGRGFSGRVSGSAVGQNTSVSSTSSFTSSGGRVGVRVTASSTSGNSSSSGGFPASAAIGLGDNGGIVGF